MIDFHCDTFMQLFDNQTQLRENNHHIDLLKLQKGGALAQVFANFIDIKDVENPKDHCANMLAYGLDQIQTNSNLIEVVKSYKDYERIKKSGKLAAILAIEEGGALEGKLENFDYFYNRGIRLITLTWNYPNEIGYPNVDYKYKDKGLTPFGIELLKLMNETGVIIDTSHLSDAGFYDCIKHSSKPIIASHSNARAIQDHTRNLTDDMLVKLANKGGIAGINYLSYFLDGSKLSKIDSMITHIDHIKKVAGIDTVTLGSDFDGINCELEIKNIGQMSLLRNKLNMRGFTCEEIDKIFFKNGERLLKDTLK